LNLQSSRNTTIEVYEESLKFEVAHFTIFSPTVRERLHGHNYHVYFSITASIGALGITVDYDIYKKKLVTLCQYLDKHLLLPGQSPVLKITDKAPYFYVHFNEEEMHFLQADCLILPIRNISLEELSHWFLGQITQDSSDFIKYGISKIVIKVSSGHGREASATVLLSF
jgi:6-pyruvoyltetrahydropterin/6-carboxytetrahydropterin synthase